MGLLTAGIRYRPHARERGAPAGPRSWAVAGMGHEGSTAEAARKIAL